MPAFKVESLKTILALARICMRKRSLKLKILGIFSDFQLAWFTDSQLLEQQECIRSPWKVLINLSEEQ